MARYTHIMYINVVMGDLRRIPFFLLWCSNRHRDNDHGDAEAVLQQTPMARYGTYTKCT